MHGKRFSESVRLRIEHERAESMRLLNASMLGLFWDIGHALLDQELRHGPGQRDRLARFLAEFYPESLVFSRRNLGHMRKLAMAFPDRKAMLRRYGHLKWAIVLRTMEASRLARRFAHRPR